jgi:predicted transposase YbfD/YdcC
LPPNFRRVFPPATEQQRQAELDSAETHEKGHGRREHRRLESSTRLARHLDWPDLAQVCRLQRTTWRQGKQVTETDFAITSAPRSQASAAQLLAWRRGHWGIENRLHWLRDTAWGEDHCRVRSGHAPQLLSAFRNAALSFLRTAGFSQITSTLREHAYRVDRLLARLGIMKY